MAQILKPSERCRVRTFSYPRKLDRDIKRIERRAEKDGLSFGDVVIEGLKLLTKKRWPDLYDQYFDSEGHLIT